MNNIQIRAFIKGLKKTKGRLTNEKTKHVVSTVDIDSSNVGVIGVSSLEQTKFRNETIRVKQSETTKRK